MTQNLKCKDKIPFKDKEDAQGAAVMAKIRYGEKPTVYKCKHCGYFHLARTYGEGE